MDEWDTYYQALNMKLAWPGFFKGVLAAFLASAIAWSISCVTPKRMRNLIRCIILACMMIGYYSIDPFYRFGGGRSAYLHGFHHGTLSSFGFLLGGVLTLIKQRSKMKQTEENAEQSH